MSKNLYQLKCLCPEQAFSSVEKVYATIRTTGKLNGIDFNVSTKKAEISMGWYG